MSAVNSVAEAYLNDYLAKPTPGFAVLLSAPWGAGKTHFVKGFLDRRSQAQDAPQDHLYVSLFGVQDRRDIDRAIGLARYNGQDAQTAERLGKVFSDVVKHWTGADLSVRIEDVARLSLPRLLVFDDLERTSMEPSEVLGAVHGLVEHEQKHLILLCNEDKLFDTDAAREIKEKTIGITLPIEPDFEAAFPAMLAGLSARATSFLEGQKDLIQHVFETANHKNLRSLSQALWDFARVLEVMTDEQIKKEAALAALFRDYLILALEYKAGTIDADALAARDGFFMKENQTEPQEKMCAVATKHRNEDLKYGREFGRFGGAVPTDLALQVIARGAVTEELVQRQLGSLSAFQDQHEEPAWRTLYWARWRTRGQVDEAYAQVLDQLSRQEITDPFIALHVFSTLIELRTPRIEPRSIADIEQAAKDYFSGMEGKDILKVSDDIRVEIRGWEHPPDSYDGLGYPRRDDERGTAFRRTWDGFVKARTEAVDRQLKTDAANLLGRLTDDPDSLILDLTSNNQRTPKWGLAPVLAHIPVEDFVDRVLDAPIDKHRTLLSILKDRLQHYRPELEPEVKWLERVENPLREKWNNLDDFRKWQVEPFVEGVSKLVQENKQE